MDITSRDRQVFKWAYAYLINLEQPGVDQALLEKYLWLPDHVGRAKTISDIYVRMLESAQSANMKAGVIGKALGGVYRLGEVLDEFNPQSVLDKYSDDWEFLLDTIEAELQPSGQIRRGSRSIWPQYCKTVLSAAHFMNRFKTAEDFYAYVALFDGDDRTRVALPLLMKEKVRGMGFALCCDFLKELGYTNFAKPDVHIRDIFTHVGLSTAHPSDLELFDAVTRVANHNGRTPYAVDKLFWLIGSGFFYDDPQIGRNGRIGSQKAAFVAFVQNQVETTK
jgi:hypothetical protein